MPELPEVETMCRAIAGAVGGRIREIARPKSRLQPISISPRIDAFRRRAIGRRIVGVRRVGKRVVIELEARADGHVLQPSKAPRVRSQGESAGPKSRTIAASKPCGDVVVIEPRMTGLVLLRHPPDREHVRLVFQVSDGWAKEIIFWDQRGLGVVRLLRADEFQECCGQKRLGPDALQIDCETLQARLDHRRQAIKVAMMDQHALAGIGNLYASEILHRAGIHPATPCDRLPADEWPKLHRAIREILRAAIRHQGSTLSDGTYRADRERPAAYQLHHRVYQRAGEPCLRCGKSQIVRIVQAQRSTFFCPVCQPMRAIGRS